MALLSAPNLVDHMIAHDRMIARPDAQMQVLVIARLERGARLNVDDKSVDRKHIHEPLQSNISPVPSCRMNHASRNDD